MQASGLHYLNILPGATGEDLCGEKLGEVVGTTSVLASEIGGMVLTQDRLAVECDQRLDSREGTEFSFVGELAVLPGFVFTLGVGRTIIIDFHCVFHLMCLTGI